MTRSARPGWLVRIPLSAIVLLGVLLHLPGLFAGFYVDDYLHQVVLGASRDAPATDAPMSPWALYDFGSAGDWDAAMDASVGSWPFWTSPDWRVRFLRPLASAALVLDHALFGGWAPGYALTGLATFAVLLVVAHRALRALGAGEGTARLALVFLAASGSTVIPVEWAANRNSLLEVLFLCAAVWAGARGRPWLGLGAALLAVLSKESGVIAFVLVPMAFALCDRGRVRPRSAVVAGLAGSGLALAYVVFLATAGYGTDSAFYATPWADPARYALGALRLAAVAVPTLVGPYPVDLAPLSASFTAWIVGAGAVLAIPIALAVARLGRGTAPGARRAFLLVWVALGVAVQGAAPLSDRLLVVPAVPAALLVAQAVAGGLEARSRLARASARALFVAAGPLAAIATIAMGAGLAQVAHEIRETAVTADVGDPSLGHRDVLVLQCTNGLVPFAIMNTWAVEQADHDLRFHLLQAGRRGLRWSRPDARTFVFETLDEPFLTKPLEVVYLVPEDLGRLDVGRAFEGRGYTARITRAGEAGPLELALTFDEPPGPAWRFLVADGTRLVHREPPAVGGTAVVGGPVPEHPFVP